MVTTRWAAWGVMVAALACASSSTSAPPSDASQDGARLDSARLDGAPGDRASGDEDCQVLRSLGAGAHVVDEVMPPASGRAEAVCDGARPVTHALVLRATVPPGERIAVQAERPAIDASNISVEITTDCAGTRCVEGAEPPMSDSVPRRARYINTTDREQTVFVRLGSRVPQGPAWARALIHIGAAQENSTCDRATLLAVDAPPIAQRAPDFPTGIRLCSDAALPRAFFRVTAAPGEAISIRVDGQRDIADFYVLNGCGLRCSGLMIGAIAWPFVFENASTETVERIIVVSRQPYSLAPYLLSAQRVALDPHAHCERAFALTPEQGYTLDPSRAGLTPTSATCVGATPLVYFRVEVPARSTRWLVARASAALQGRAAVYGVFNIECPYVNCGGLMLNAGRAVGAIPIENTSDAPATRIVAVGRVEVTVPLSISVSPTAP